MRFGTSSFCFLKTYFKRSRTVFLKVFQKANAVQCQYVGAGRKAPAFLSIQYMLRWFEPRVSCPGKKSRGCDDWLNESVIPM